MAKPQTSPETMERFFALVGHGVAPECAAQMVGIPPRDIAVRARRDAAFAARLKESEGAGLKELRSKLKGVSMADMSAAMSLLERRPPKPPPPAPAPLPEGWRDAVVLRCTVCGTRSRAKALPAEWKDRPASACFAECKRCRRRLTSEPTLHFVDLELPQEVQ